MKFCFSCRVLLPSIIQNFFGILFPSKLFISNLKFFCDIIDCKFKQITMGYKKQLWTLDFKTSCLCSPISCIWTMSHIYSGQYLTSEQLLIFPLICSPTQQDNMSLVVNCFLHVKILSTETMYPLKHSLFTKGPCIMYVGGGAEGFCGVIEYFRHIFGNY